MTAITASATTPHVSPSAAPDTPELLRTHNLLNDAMALSDMLLAALAPCGERGLPRERLLDAFLVAAALCQIMDDDVHRDAFALRKVSTVVSRMRGRAPQIVARLCAGLGQALFSLRRRLPSERNVIDCQIALADLAQRLADELVGADSPARASATPGDLLPAARSATAHIARAPRRVRRDVARIPSCFRSFDQYPEDFVELARRFAERWPDRSQPLVVVGVRTSGSYLAPLLAGALRTLGYQRVALMTLRPGQRWLPRERAHWRAIAASGARALLVDDPPGSGGTVAKAARECVRQGVPSERISVVLALFGALDSLPEPLRAYDAVCLPFDNWAVHQRLVPEAARQSLTSLLHGRTIWARDGAGAFAAIQVARVDDVQRAPLTFAPQIAGDLPGWRSHIRARYAVQVTDAATGRPFWLDVYAKGSGLGYLGRHAEVIASALGAFAPETYGAHDSILYRAWLPEAARLSQAMPSLAAADLDAVAVRVAEYVAKRRAALGVPEDMARRLVGRSALWQECSDLLGGVFGQAASLIRPVLHRCALRLLGAATTPSVPDGSMALAHWFTPPNTLGAAGGLVKVDLDERAFSNLERSCYDALYDLAAFAAQYERLALEDRASSAMAPERFARRLREHYRIATGETIGKEPWVLYQLLALAVVRHEQTGVLADMSVAPDSASASGAEASITGREWAALAASPQSQAQRAAVLRTREATDLALSRIFMRYIGERFFADLTPPTTGPLCAIDIDGVLETGQLGFTAISPAGAQALRALTRHGYRPVLATGRALDDVRARCAAYRLAAGVAEYGSVAFNAVTGETLTLVSPADRAALERLRAVLERMDGVFLDPAYHYSVRAFRLDKHGQRRGLAKETITVALRAAEADEALRPIPGACQTDFVAASVDKGTGLAALHDMLEGSDAERQDVFLAFAAGDTVSDLAMFRHAALAYAPANADEAVWRQSRAAGSPIRIARRAYQAGLLLAVADLLGHHPRGCSTCRPPLLTRDAQALMLILGAMDRSKWGKLGQAVLLLPRLIHRG